MCHRQHRAMSEKKRLNAARDMHTTMPVSSFVLVSVICVSER